MTFVMRVCVIPLALLTCMIYPLFAQNIVTIESARTSEYSKDPQTGNEIITLSGGVLLSVVKGNDKSIIRADLVVFDRKREMIYARGSVFLTHEKGGSTEALSGDSLLFNSNSMEGIFEQGTFIQSDTAKAQTADTQNRVSSQVFGRTTGGSTTFDHATLTFCDDDDPHWKINASKVWMLPGNEFAFFNAILFVGKIPVFYLPVFYLPKDEMIFNPVFGYRVREGFFLQSTTYLIGRKPLEKSDENNFFSFTSQTGELKEQVRDGLFLRNLDSIEKNIPKDSLKILGDIYSGLGFLVGVDAAFAPNDSFKKIQLTLNVGFSKNLYPISNYQLFTPYNKKGVVEWNNSYFFSLKLPFRYSAQFALEYNKQPFSLNISLPLYSDPFFKTDFFNRKETMDWFGFLTENPAFTTANQNQNEVSSFTWNMMMQFKPKIDIVKPYISTLDITRFTSNIQFASRQNTELSTEQQGVDPQRKFFFPTIVTPLATDVLISGNLFKYPVSPQAHSQSTAKTKKDDTPLIPQGQIPPEVLQEPTKTTPIKNEYEETLLPAITTATPSFTAFSGFSYSLDYSLTPKFSSEIQYISLQWRKPADINWKDFASSFYSFNTQSSVKSTASWRGSFVSLSNALQFNTTHQDHPLVSSTYYTETQKNQIKLNDLKAQKQSLLLNNTLSFRPLYFIPIVSATSLSWNSGLKILTREFDGTIADPSWNYNTASWNKESFAVHNMNAVISADINGIVQSLSLTGNLPPLLEKYTALYKISIPIVPIQATFSSQIGSAYYKKSEQGDSWLFQPLTLNNNFSIPNMLSISQEFSYDIEKQQATRLTLNVSGFGAKLSYAAYYTNAYRLDPINGWQQKAQQEFLPASITTSYTLSAKNFYSWQNRIKIIPAFDTSLSFNLIRQTESYFTFSPSLTFTINDFLNVTFSSQSRNDVVFRYIQDAVGFTPLIPGETNAVKDLWDSFSFWDIKARQRSGFKLKSLSVKVEHNLHDWQLNAEFTIKPRLITTRKPYSYDFSPYFSLSVSWKPFQGLKTQIVDEYGTFILNP